MPEGQRFKGTVAKWLNHKGIGFITPEGEEVGEKDILVHFAQIKQETDDGFKSLNQGAEVEYSLEADPKNSEKMIAVDVTGPEGAECEPKKPKGKGKSKGAKGGDGEEGDDDYKPKGKGKKGKGKGKGGKKGKGKGKERRYSDDE